MADSTNTPPKDPKPSIAIQNIAEPLNHDFSDSDPEHDGSGQNVEKRTKRSRACQACRNMKIRCNPVDGQEACRACAKVNRPCVMPGPPRKRQKTVHKVAELERKIDALTQSLLAKDSNPTPPNDSPAFTEHTRSSISVPQPTEAEKPSPYDGSNKQLVDYLPDVSCRQPLDPNVPNPEPYVDVIERGIMSVEFAAKLLDKFRTDQNPFCPLVGFRETETVQYYRTRRPMLLLAIMGVAAGALAPSLQADLKEELARQLADRVFFYFEKSLDLVQTMLILAIWHGKHRQAKDMGFNQYIHSAVVMALDLGLGKRSRVNVAKSVEEDAELRRTWLACYMTATTVSLSLRLPPLVRFSTYLQECLDWFSTSPIALRTDHILCSLVRMEHILEDVAMMFHMDDPGSNVSLHDTSTQYHLKLFERKLADWKVEAKKYMDPAILSHLEAVSKLYIHEVSLHHEHNVDDFRPQFHGSDRETTANSNTPITSLQLDSLTTCVCCIKQALDTFLAMEQSTLQNLPCLTMVWTTYAAVAMIRLDALRRAPNSKYSEVYLPDLETGYYLDAIFEKLQKQSQAGLVGTTGLFIAGIAKLKLWHSHKISGGTVPEFADDLKGGLMKIDLAADSIAVESQRRTKPTASKGLPPNEAESSLLNSNVPIDAALFEAQDWNFTLQDWNNFDNSLNEPASTSWIGWLI